MEDTRRLKEYQEEPSPKEDLAKIPHLKRSDLRKEDDYIVYTKAKNRNLCVCRTVI